MSGLTTRAAPPEAAPETTLTASPWDWLYALIVGFDDLSIAHRLRAHDAFRALGADLMEYAF